MSFSSVYIEPIGTLGPVVEVKERTTFADRFGRHVSFLYFAHRLVESQLLEAATEKLYPFKC